jgi:streptogramin lyase
MHSWWPYRSRSRRPAARGARATAQFRSFRPQLVQLEDRCAPAVLSLPSINPAPSGPQSGIVTGPDGNLWFTEPNNGKIGQLTTAGSLTEFQLVANQTGNTTANSATVTNLQDTTKLAVGMIVTTPNGANIAPNTAIVSIDSATQITLSAVAGTTTAAQTLQFNSQPTGITSDGTNLWFTESATDKIAKITATALTVSTASWATGVATFTTASAHNLTTGQVVVITGVNPSGYNVTGAVTVTNSTQFTVLIASNPGTYVSGGSVRVITEFSIADPSTTLTAGGSLPQPTLNVVSTTGFGPSGTLTVQTTPTTMEDGTQTGQSIQALTPANTLKVASTTGFNLAGIINVQTDAGTVQVFYTGTTSNTFTGCTTSGSGNLIPSGTVTQTYYSQVTYGASTPNTFTSCLGGAGSFIANNTVTEASKPTGIAFDGINLWFTEQGTNKIGRITTGGTITQFAIPTVGSQPTGITLGPDGNLWFTEFAGNKIGKITPAGAITEVASLAAGSGPSGITTGPDGNLWFTEQTGNKIGQITTAGTVSQFSTGLSASSLPTNITVGADGNLWFTENLASTSFIPAKIGEITSSDHTITELNLPFLNPNIASYQPFGIAAGPDGNIWFTDSGTAQQIGKVILGGVVSAIDLGQFTHSFIYTGIAMGSDGNLFFAQNDASKIGKMTPAAAAPTSSGATAAPPVSITAGPSPDTNLWFTEYNLGTQLSEIGKVSLTPGTPTNFTIGLTAKSEPFGITSGPDGNLWFTELLADKIGMITPGSPNTITEFSIVDPSTNLNMSGTLPQSTITVLSTSGFTSAGTLKIQTTTGFATVTYTGISGNTFTGCSGGSGTLAASGTVTEFSNPTDITSDGTNLWFTEQGTNKIAKITTGLTPTITEFSVPTANSQPYGVALGSDGKIWFTEEAGNKVARINTDGTGLTEFSVPSSGKPGHMSTGPGGNLYFLEAAQTQVGAVLSGLAKIGMIATNGSITEFAIPSGGLPRAITKGPDGNVWFTTANKEIGKLVPNFTDNFAGSSGSSLSTNWGVVSNPAGAQGTWPAGSFTLNGSNQAVAGGTGVNIAIVVDGFRSATTAPAAGFTPPSTGNSLTVSADVDISTPATSTGRYGGVVARWGAGSAWNGLVNNVIQTTSAASGYVGLIYQDSSSLATVVMLGKIVGNQLILLSPPVTLVSVASESGNVKLQVAGTTLTLTFTPTLGSPTVITATDSSITTGWGAGIVDFGGGTKFGNFTAFDPSLTHIDTFAAPTLATDSSVSAGTPPTGLLAAITLQADVSAALALTSAAGPAPDVYAIRLVSEVFAHSDAGQTRILYNSPGSPPWESFWKGEAKVGGGGGDSSVDGVDEGETSGDALDKLMASNL